jgi:hypothetical protein
MTVTALIGHEKIAANMQLQLAEEWRRASEQRSEPLVASFT